MGIKRNPICTKLNPFTGEFIGTSFTNNYLIPSTESYAGVCVIDIAMQLDVTAFTNASTFDIVNTQTGGIESTLTPVLFNSPQASYPNANQIVYYNIANCSSFLYVNSDHAGKLLRVTSQAVGNVLSTNYVNMWSLPLGSIISVNNTLNTPPLYYALPCGFNGNKTSVNRFVYPAYNELMTSLNFPYGKDSLGNPYTPYLTEHVLRGSNGSVNHIKSVGNVENNIVFPKIGFDPQSFNGYDFNSTGSSKSELTLNPTRFNNMFTQGRPLDFQRPVFANNTLKAHTTISNDDLSSPYLSVQFYIVVE